MHKKKKLIVVVVLLVFVSLVVLVVLLGRKHPTVKPPETSTPGTVVIDNTEGLRSTLLRKQYTAVNKELIVYIQKQVASTVEHAFIVDQPTINKDGTITLKLQTEKPTKQFVVRLDRNTYFNKVVFFVPETNYRSTIDVYSQEDVGD